MAKDRELGHRSAGCEQGFNPDRLLQTILISVACYALAVAIRPGAAGAEAQRAVPVDLELVLAVDASSSVDMEEFNLQMRGLAEAFRHPAVLGAIRSAGELGVAVCLDQWADTHKYELTVDWTVVIDELSAANLASEIMEAPRTVFGGGTDIRGAIRFALQQFERHRFEGVRKVIDISGDGRANVGDRPTELRDRAVAQGITVNGLVIVNEDPLVDSYYLDNVVGGTGAFLMTVDSYGDFAAAVLKKLVREIKAAPLASPLPSESSVHTGRTPEAANRRPLALALAD